MNFEKKYFCLIIIESIPENERKTGTILHEELIKYKKIQEPNFESQLRIIDSRLELIDLLHEINELQKTDGLFPYLHFEMHGHQNGLALKNGEFINWSDLIPLFRKINYLTKNYLTLHFGSCYSGSIMKYIDFSERAPFRALIGAPYKINVGQIEIGFAAYYDDYFFSLDSKTALIKLNNEIEKAVFFRVSSEYCFDKITNIDLKTESGNEMISILWKRHLEQSPALRLLPQKQQDEIALNIINQEIDRMKSFREYFLMLDLKTENYSK